MNAQVSTPSFTPATIPCCECGTLIQANPANTCINCLKSKVDITDGITKQVTLFWCRGCGRYQRPPYEHIELESREMLALCLQKIKGLNKEVKLVDASFIWTEPHSKRIKVKLTIQKEVFHGAILQQMFVVEFVVQNQQCLDCQKSYTEHTWAAVVQIRQAVEHKKTMLYLEQMLLKHNVCEKAQSIKEMPGGMDIYWGSKSGANHLIEFLKGVVPIRTTIAKKLISQDDNCFPAADHQILTDVGFMSLGDVHAAIQRNGHVQVACYVQKSRTIEFHPVGADGVVDKLVEEPLIEFSRPTHPAAGFDNQLNLQVTADHEMYVHAGKGESTWHKVTAAEMYSNKSVPSKVHMLGFADGGVAARDFSTPGFAAALGLTTADEITAFLELYGFWLGGGSLVTSARAVTIAVVKKHDAAWLRQTLARLPLHIRQTGAPLREGGWSWHKSGKVTHFLILEQKWWDFFAAEYGAEYAVPAAASPSFAAALVCPSPSSAAASSAAAALSSGRSSELSAAASVSVSQEGRKRTASFAGASLEVCDSLALAEEDGDSSSDDEAAPVWDKTGSVLALDDAVPRQVAAGVFDAVAAAAKQFEATRGEAARVVLEPTAYTMTKPGRVTDYTAGATCKVVYQLHGPMNVKYGKTADGRASVTAKVLQRAVSHAAVRFDGVVVAELVPVVWDDWFDEELTEMLLGVGGAEGVYAPVARTAIRAAFGSGALVVVAFGDHVQQRCSEVAAVVGGRTEIVEGVVHYVASVDGGRSVDVVECVHPSAPGALASVTVAVALAQLITDGKAWVQELPALVALFTRMEAITKPAKHLAAWVLAELSRDQLRAIISGLRRADGDQTGVDTHGKGGGVVWTASVVTRDEYQRLFLLAGYSSYFNVKYLKGSTHGAGVHGDEFKANHTLWAVHFANDTTRFAQPSVQRDRDLRQVAFAGRVWCVNVPHKDHLIFVRRVLQVGEKGEVVAASPPIITGNSNIFNYKYSMFVEIPAICKDDLVALEPKLCSMLGGVSQLLLCTRITAGLHLLDPVSLKLVEVSAGTFFHHRFRSQVSAKQLQEYVILDIEKIDSARKEADHPNALDMRSFNKQKLVMNQKMCLAVATVARVSDMGKNDTTFEIKTHLGHMLNPGDTALGYDLTKANWNDDVKISKKHGLPAVCLVRKSYPKRNRAGRRAFALKHLPKEESEAPPKKMDLLRSEQEMEEFLNEIEEDPEMQGKVNLYRKQGQGVVASARGEAAAASSSSMSDSDMGTGAGGDHVDGDEGAADEEFPQIDMDALLDDLGAVTIGAFDDQAGKEVDTDNEAVEMDGPPQSSAASSHGGPTQAKGRNNVKGRK